MHTRFGLLLLGAAALAAGAGCPAGDEQSATASSEDTGSTGVSTSATASSAAPTSSPSTTTSSTTQDPTDTTSTTTLPETSGTSSTTTTSPTSGSSAVSSGSDSGSESTGGGAEACTAGCQVEVDCGFCATKWKSVETCVEWCTGNLDLAGEFSLACRGAWRDSHACIGTLTCEEFTAWCAREPPDDYPCIGADEALSFECQGQ